MVKRWSGPSAELVGLMGRRFLVSLHVWVLLSPLALFQHCRGAGSGPGLWLRGLGAAGKEARTSFHPAPRRQRATSRGKAAFQRLFPGGSLRLVTQPPAISQPHSPWQVLSPSAQSWDSRLGSWGAPLHRGCDRGGAGQVLKEA